MVNEEIKKQDSESVTSDKLKALQSVSLAGGLKFIGWLYLLISLIGGIVLIAKSKVTHIESLYTMEYSTSINYAYRALGIMGIITSLIVLLVCLGIAKIIQQNAYLLKLNGKGV